MFENRFSVDIIGRDNICVNLQVIEMTVLEGVRFGHISLRQDFSFPIGHPTPNLLCVGCKNKVKIRKKSRILS